MADKKYPSLKSLVILIIGICLLLFALVFFLFFRNTASQILLRSEEKYLVKQLDLVEGLLKDSLHTIFRFTNDLGIWEETVRFAEGNNPDFFADHWPDSSLLNVYEFNFIEIRDADGQILHSEFLDYIKGENLPMPPGLSASLDEIFAEVMEKNRLGKYSENSLEEMGRGGIVYINDTAYLLAVMPIKGYRSSKNPAGVVIMGNVLDNRHFKELTHYYSVDFKIIPGNSDVSVLERPIQFEKNNMVSTTLSLTDINGNPLSLKMEDHRVIYADGEGVLIPASVIMILMLAVLLLALYAVIVKLILIPIARLNQDMKKIAAEGVVHTETYSRSREFADLCSSINDMLATLNRSNISLTVFKSILNGMDAYLYVTDPGTDEILFINDKMKKHFGVEGEGVGQICWKVLQKDMTERCSFCPLYQLNKGPGETVVWEEHNTATGRIYRNTDCFIQWPGNRLAHLQHSVDITEIKNAEHDIMERLEQQELMSAMSQSFISTESMENLINNALKMAGEFMDVSFIMLMAYSSEDKVLEIKNTWHNADFLPPGGPIPFHQGTIEYDTLVTKSMSDMVFDDISEIKEFEGPQAYGVKALIGVPMVINGVFWGILEFSECTQPRVWTESDIQLIRLIGSVITGVIERNRMEERYVRMADIVNSSPQYISYVNTKGIFEFVNQGALDILGYSPEEIIGKDISLILDEQIYQYAMEVLIPRVLKEGKLDFELPVIRKDREIRILSFSSFKTEFNTQGISVIALDVTEKKRLEKKLIIAMEQAEASNRAKSEFLSRMSHEMRTPMNAIIGMTHIAKSSDDPVKKEYCLDKIDEASIHLLGVINDILDMSKIEAGKFELSETEFNFEKMLIRVINVVNFRIDEKKQNLVVHTDPSMPHFIVADEQRLAQVITNLLSNAVKFTPEGGTITLSAKNLEDGEGDALIRVKVADTGIGISKKQQENLFRSFEQADGSISRKFGGTGLGLVISKKIVELMDGKIRVESDLGKGSTFIFEIRVKKGRRTRKNLLNPEINWKNLRILVVDDTREVLDYFKSLADSLEVYCETALGGEEALDRIEKNLGTPFNIIFIDWKMPGMNGVELTKKIKSRYGSNVVIIMISAVQWEDIEKEAKQAGVNGYIPKPLFSSQIVNCIAAYLGPDKGTDNTLSKEDAIRDIFSGTRILLVEDIEINREIVISLLDPTGAIIDGAENGVEALRIFEENPFAYNAILMDIHMPEMDGFEATRRLRHLDLGNAKTIPIIAMTANVFREDIEKCLEAGMNDHVGKPVDMDDLIAKLKKYLLPAGDMPGS